MDDDDDEKKKQKEKEWMQAYLAEDPVASLEAAMREVPLLMSELPNADVDVSNNTALAALQSLLYEGTPEEIAENFKNQGNEAFREGSRRYRDALEFYTKALAAKSSDRLLNSAVLSNRASVQLEFQNYGMARADCIAALRLNPSNVKACYRAAKACRMVGRLAEAVEFLQKGLTVEPDNMALKGEKLHLEGELRKERMKQEEKEREAREAAQVERKLQEAIKMRGIRMASSTTQTEKEGEGEGEFPLQNVGDAKVYLDDEGALHWPLFFLYPEYKTSDFVRDFCEENTFGDHLQEMFPKEGPLAPWDTDRKYVEGGLSVYFETARKRDGTPALARVDADTSLRDVLSDSNFVVKDGIPSFFVTVTDSAFDKHFRSRYSKKPS